MDRAVGAVSKMQRLAAGKRKKNDCDDAGFLARQLIARNVVEVKSARRSTGESAHA